MIGAHTRIQHHSARPLAGMRRAIRAAAVDPTTPYGYATVLAVLRVLADRYLGGPTATATALLIAGALVGVCAVGAAALGTASVPRRLAVDTPAWQRLHVAAVGLSAVTGAVGVLTLPRGHEAWFMVGCASGVVFLVAVAVESTVGARLDAARTGLRPEPKRVLAPGADVAEWHARREASIASLLRLEPVQETSAVPDVPEMEGGRRRGADEEVPVTPHHVVRHVHELVAELRGGSLPGEQI